MGAPKKLNEAVVKTLIFEKKQWELLRRLKLITRISISGLVRNALDQFLQNHPDIEKAKKL